MQVIPVSPEFANRRELRWCQEMFDKIADPIFDPLPKLEIPVGFTTRKVMGDYAGRVYDDPLMVFLNTSIAANRRTLGMQHYFAHEIAHIIVKCDGPWLQAMHQFIEERPWAAKAVRREGRSMRPGYPKTQLSTEILCETFAEALYPL